MFCGAAESETLTGLPMLAVQQFCLGVLMKGSRDFP